jgi:hypothetical protein
MPAARLDVPDAGRLGIVGDMPYNDLPPNAWTAGQNVRMSIDEVVAFPGEELVSENLELERIQGLYGTRTPISAFWVLGGASVADGLVQAKAYDGSTYTDISPVTAPWVADGTAILIGDVLNQNLIVATGVDQPQFWDLNLGNTFELLPGWDATWTCEAVKSFKGHLIALNMRENDIDLPYRVRWSDQADPGGLPQSWDALDPTVLAGAQDLGDTTGALQNGLILRDSFMLYTEREMIAMQFVAGEFTFQFRNVSRTSGLIAKRAVSTVRGQHVAVTDQDVIMSDGQSVNSIIDRKMRSFLFNQIDEENFRLTYTVVHAPFNEVWVCFATQGMSYCNQALVWNWVTNSWGVRDLPVGNLAAANVLDIQGLATLKWDTNPFTWATWDRRWNQRNYDATNSRLILGGNAQSTSPGSATFRTEETNQFAGVPRQARVEKLGLRVLGEQNFTVHELWPRATGGVFTVDIGSQMAPNGPVSWKKSQDFDPETDRKITCRVSGKYLCLAFHTEEDTGWRLEGFSVKYRSGGHR